MDALKVQEIPEGGVPLMVTLQEAARLCGLHVRTLRRRAAEDVLQTKKVFGRRLVDYRSLQEMLGISDK